MDVRSLTFDCTACGQQHRIDIDFDLLSPEQRNGTLPLPNRFICQNVARMYRVFGFALDTRAAIFNVEGAQEAKKQLSDSLRDQWGDQSFALKLERFKKLNLSYLGIPDEYYGLLRQIVDSYCCGYFYPAMTSAGALGERILNRLLIRTRDYFKGTPQYKAIYRKRSFDSWDKPISVLMEWNIISADVAEAFHKLKDYRNDSIHYQEGYSFEENAKAAITQLASIIDLQFNYTRRKDLFWIFDVPGEIWLRSEQSQDPFVKEFVLPHCAWLSAYCEPSSSGLIAGRNAPLAPLSDEDFLAARKAKQT